MFLFNKILVSKELSHDQNKERKKSNKICLDNIF